MKVGSARERRSRTRRSASASPTARSSRRRTRTRRYSGWITIRNALGNSLNIPAFKAAQAARRPRHRRICAGSVGLTDLDGSYGPSIAIGGVDIKALDLAYAYSVLANSGVMRGQRRRDRARPGRTRAIDPVAILNVARPQRQRRLRARSTSRRSGSCPPQQAYLVNGHPLRPERAVHHLRLRRPQRPRLQGGGEDGHERALRPARGRTPARSARPGPSATRRTSSSASGPATPTTRRSSTSSAPRSPSGRCATSCLTYYGGQRADAVHAARRRGQAARLLHLTRTHVC